MTLKKLIYLMLIALIFVIVCACALTTPRPANGMINPGDRIGDFLITTGGGETVIFVTKLHCPYDSRSRTVSCEQPAGTRVNAGSGINDNYPFKGMTLDEYWSGQICEMFIEGRPVNLQAFGSIDFSRPAIGTERVWNVVIVSDNPGSITIRSKGMVDGYPFDNTAILTFTAP